MDECIFVQHCTGLLKVVQCIGGQRHLQACGHIVCQDLICRPIFDGRQIGLLIGAIEEVCYVGQQYLAWNLLLELTVQEIRYYCMLPGGFHHSSVWICLAYRTEDIVFLHDPFNTFQVVDNTKLPFKGHLDLPCTFINIFERVCLQDVLPGQFISPFLIPAGFLSIR